MKSKPAFFLNIIAPSESFDINLSPDKREIALLHESILIDRIKEKIDEIYSPAKYTYQVSQIATSIDIRNSFKPDINPSARTDSQRTETYSILSEASKSISQEDNHILSSDLVVPFAEVEDSYQTLIEGKKEDKKIEELQAVDGEISIIESSPFPSILTKRPTTESSLSNDSRQDKRIKLSSSLQLHNKISHMIDDSMEVIEDNPQMVKSRRSIKLHGINSTDIIWDVNPSEILQVKQTSNQYMAHDQLNNNQRPTESCSAIKDSLHFDEDCDLTNNSKQIDILTRTINKQVR